MQEYIKNLADIDTCNIHALKSMAKSIDAEHLTNFIKENYPVQLINLINLFSIKKSILFDNFKILNMSAIAPIVGNIDNRSATLIPSKYYISILNDIINNIDKLAELFKVNKLPYIEKYLSVKDIPEYKEYMLYTLFDPEQFEKLFNISLSNKDRKIVMYKLYNNGVQEKPIEYITLYDIIQTIKYFKSQKDKTEDFNWIKSCTLTKPYFEENDFTEDDTAKFMIGWINPFHILMQVFKGYLFNYNINTFFQTMYIEKNTNVLIDLSDLYCKIIETMQIYDESYINDFITFHFYGLFYDMIINDSLKNDWDGNNFIAKTR